METITISTTDGFLLKGSYFEAEGGEAVLLLHMLGRNRHDLDNFAKQLQSQGITALSIDLRGHGESTLRREEKFLYSSFTEKDFNDIMLDVDASRDYLKEKNKMMAGIVGASIGANIAFKYGAADNQVKAIVLLSPGENYRGINIAGIKTEKPIFIIASSEDEYSADTTVMLEKILPNRKVRVLNDKGHGTEMLNKNIDQEIIDWLKEQGVK